MICRYDDDILIRTWSVATKAISSAKKVIDPFTVLQRLISNLNLSKMLLKLVVESQPDWLTARHFCGSLIKIRVTAYTVP